MLRGAGFAFRKAVLSTRDRRAFGAVFAISSVIVPYCFGAIAGAIASGRVPAGGVAGDPWDSWVNPTSILGGVLAVCVVRLPRRGLPRLGRPPTVRRPVMIDYFRIRAIAAAIVAGVVAFVGIFVLSSDAEYLFDGLTSRALPLVIVSAICGVGSLVLLLRANHRGARLAAVGAVAAVIVGWGVAQWDYMLPESLTVDEAAAPSGTIGAVLVATVLAVLFIFPAIGFLFVLDQRGMLPEESVPTTSLGDGSAAAR